jgi:hypothetical protein
MISPSSVNAQVVDIRSTSKSLPKSVVADANVLYFVYYDFASLSGAGVALPSFRQRNFYSAWFARALSSGVTLCATYTTFAEYVHLVERMELNCHWVTDPNKPELDPANPGQSFSPQYVKKLRYHYHDRLQVIRANVETYLKSVQKNVALLPALRGDGFGAVIQAWSSSSSDIGDAALVAEAKLAGIPRVISDDADFVSFDGIQLYTANSGVISAAAQANKLLR